MDLPEYKLKEIEEKVFFNSFIVSPRNAAKMILESMDEANNPDFLEDRLLSPIHSLRKDDGGSSR